MAWCHHAITQMNVELVLWRHMASLGPDDFKRAATIAFKVQLSTILLLILLLVLLI